ncbi:hypothetical protein [Jejuia pallidilutea]|uniref:Uncharacterized protein n=1 Tax=Jejuia pallidilutea TaxID=504487 RepID=A0A090W8M7_9FLAO|nr:conserved hypothetical protein [Jejuia pallidilutea]
MHPNGAVSADGSGALTGEDVSIFGIDAFYDAPVGDNGAAITAYALAQFNDYGKNYTLGRTYETGSLIHGHLGYVIPSESKTKFQPYFQFDNRQIDALNDAASSFGIGANVYFSGHNSKLTLEYFSTKYANTDAVGTLTLQAMIYI